MAPAYLTEVTNMSHLLSSLVMLIVVVLLHFVVSAHTAIVCEGWCYPAGVCVSTGTHCGCNTTGNMYSTCAHRLQPDPEADCHGKCHNGGTCILLHGFAVCHCSSGYHGYSCEFITKETCSKPCMNGGTCQTTKINNVTAEACICLLHHYGDLCHLSSSECTEPCFNGGVCQWGSCLCPNGYHGIRCEEPEVAYFDESARHPQRLSPGNIAAIVVIVFVTLGLSVGVRYFRKWKIRRLRRNRQNHNAVLNNRPWVERSCSSHSGVNFVRIPDVSPLHSPNPIPPSYSCSTSSSGGFTVNLNQDNGDLMASGEMPPPYEAVVDNGVVPSKSNAVRFQELNCRSLDET